MAWIRQLPSGLWAATVRLPTGKRITETDRLKGRIERWADELESDVRRGDWIDPRDGEHTVGECWARWGTERRLEKASIARDRSHWKNHVEHLWASVPVGSILTPDVEAWVTKMERAHKDGCEQRSCGGCRYGAATIEGAVGVLRAMLHQAVKARWIRFNPATKIKIKERPASTYRLLHPDEDDLLLGAMDRLFPGRSDGRLACELMLYGGLRWEEMGAIDREHVELRKAVLQIGPVLERDGSIRPYPKTPAGVRPVPVDDDLWPRVRAHVMTLPPGGLLVTAPKGGPLDYSHWYRTVWRVALDGLPAREAKRGRAARDAVDGADLADPQPTPHDLRHTYCTRLGEQGMPGHELIALTGHENLASVQRYLHAGEDRFDRARAAMRRAKAGGTSG